MAISQSSILQYEGRVSVSKSADVINEAKKQGLQTAFLCHSHQDARLAKSLQAFLHDKGWKVYIDWDDTSMPDKPNQETASRIKKTIKDLRWFIFLATQNSTKSRWCPWEIGYADGVKPTDTILIVPTFDYQGTYGNEYLALYRHIDVAESGAFAVFKPDKTGIYLSQL